MGERKAVTNKMAATYRRGTRAEKAVILDQLCALTGWHRDHARARLRQAGEIRVVRVRTPRTPTYSPRVLSALELTWRVTRAPAGKRLAPMLPVLVSLLRRDGELDLSDDEAALLCQMSAATIDRRLKGARVLLELRGKKVIKRHDRAKTPLQRLIDAGILSPAKQGARTKTRNALHPVQLQREIARLCRQLEHVTLEKTIVPQRAVNRAFKANF